MVTGFGKRGFTVARLENVRRSIEQTENVVEKLDKNATAIAQRAMQDSFLKMRPQVRRMLESNLKSSGVGSKTKGRQSTGRLASAVKNSSIQLRFGKGKAKHTPRIAIFMPKNIGDYAGGKGGGAGNFYKAAASLNFGSVYAEGSSAGERAKRTFKKKAVSGKVRAGTFLGGARLGGEAKQIGNKIEFGKGVHIIKATPYFLLAPSQVMMISAKMTEDVNRKLWG